MPLFLRIGCWGGRWLRGYLGWTFNGQSWYVVYWLIVEGGRASEGRRKGERGWSIINGVIGARSAGGHECCDIDRCPKDE